MTTNPLEGSELTLHTGLPPEDLKPDVVCYRTEVLLAQAETLGRLNRTAEQERKLLWTFAVAYDCFALHPDVLLAVITASRVARIAGRFDLAAKMLRIARKLHLSERDSATVRKQEVLLERVRDVDAAGSRNLMETHLITYLCQHCGHLVEYISLPCWFCGWQPLTIKEASQSCRLATPWMSLWDLMKVGRGIVAGHKVTEVVPNLAEAADASMANRDYKEYVEGAVESAKWKKDDGSFFYYLNPFHCDNCSANVPRHDPFVTHCERCQTKLRIPPPIKLLNCLARVSIHFQHNFGGEPSENVSLLVRYLVSLQSKLFAKQETPSPSERSRVLELMAGLGTFMIINNFGVIDMSDPKHIVLHHNESGMDVNAADGRIIVEDFRDTLQFLADWMFRTKALC
jgi:hypothetical protein